uniref:transcription factor bHLH95-like n=1 Tax=Erigeron canadensis TaxID=72917 RepID=UPI001CB97C0E|nr:transcription factor bHLH95-like [Erigeron canadensis]
MLCIYIYTQAPKFRVIEETMSSIESLKQTLQSLEKQKVETRLGLFTKSSTVEPLIDQSSLISSPATNKEPPGLLSSMNNSNTISSAGTSALSNTFKTWTSSNVTLSMCGISAVISICSLKRHGLFTTICLILKNHNLDVVSAEIFSTHHAKTMYMIHVRGYVPPEFTEGFPYEKLYKKAVAQIKFCLDV